MNVIVADFTEAERELVADILQQRYIRRVTPELADSELKLDPAAVLAALECVNWREHPVQFAS